MTENAQRISKLYPNLTFRILHVDVALTECLCQSPGQTCIMIHTRNIGVAEGKALLTEG